MPAGESVYALASDGNRKSLSNFKEPSLPLIDLASARAESQKRREMGRKEGTWQGYGLLSYSSIGVAIPREDTRIR